MSWLDAEFTPEEEAKIEAYLQEKERKQAAKAVRAAKKATPSPKKTPPARAKRPPATNRATRKKAH